MSEAEDLVNTLNRMIKIALDTGEASSVEEAVRIFSQYRLQLIVGPDIVKSPVLQAALLTAVNCASRCMMGGVSVVGAMGPLIVALPGAENINDAVIMLGGELKTAVDPTIPALLFGEVVATLPDIALQVTFDGWSGGVMPAKKGCRLAERGSFTPAGVLSGSLGVSEIFQYWRRSRPEAGRRTVGYSLWNPEENWRAIQISIPPFDCLPSAAWVIGLGNLGQAYLWTLSLLPYGGSGAELVLQDFDHLSVANLSTSLLTFPAMMGKRKTRALADWAERRGFKTTIIERPFDSDFRVSSGEPSVALVGVDNVEVRRKIEQVGFARVIEAGLGRGPQDYLGIDLHTFPASRNASVCWPDTDVSSSSSADKAAYRALAEKTGDQCGTVRLAGRAIGAPFVGAVAASFVIAEFIRLAMGAHRYEFFSCHLRGKSEATSERGDAWPVFNIGSILVDLPAI